MDTAVDEVAMREMGFPIGSDLVVLRSDDHDEKKGVIVIGVGVGVAWIQVKDDGWTWNGWRWAYMDWFTDAERDGECTATGRQLFLGGLG